MEQQQFKYYAFISYSSRDIEWGKRVQRKLESYRLPATLCSEHGWERTPIKPIFFAPYDIQPGGLSEELQQRLRLSRNLIVIGSPNSAQSEWVGKEIEFFHRLGRTSEIHYFIVGGEPNSGEPATECYNPILKHLGVPEILGANIHERVYRWPWLNRERAYVQLVSKLLGVEFNDIWQRHKRLLIQKTIAWTLIIMAVLSALVGVWFSSQPVDVEVRLNEASVHNRNLPPLKNAVVTLTLDNEAKTDTLRSLNDQLTFTNIPHKYLDRQVRVVATCESFVDIDTLINLTKDITLNIFRNPAYYGDIHFRIWNPLKGKEGEPMAHIPVKVAGREVLTGERGEVHLSIPLEAQGTAYLVVAPFPLDCDTIHTPCGEYDVISLK